MIDLAALKARVAAETRVIRVVIAAHQGSSPREVGAAMLVWEDGTEGTIGGGALEWQAMARARGMLAGGPARHSARHLDRVALGPGIGQCCGGAVTLFFEAWDSEALAAIEGDLVARPTGANKEMPLAVRRLLARARRAGERPGARLVEGWMVEPVAAPARDIWIWGAGHVGRALVQVLAPLPEFAITWVDSGAGRFPETVTEGVAPLWAENPADLVEQAPERAEHIVLTYSHALDLELCHRIMTHGHGGLGLIGSATKAARFRSRLAALGHGPEAIARLICPIGDPGLGKHPQAIAVGVAAALLRERQTARVADHATRNTGKGG